MSHVVTVPELLDGHTVLDIECLDRIYLNGYVPGLQVGGQGGSFMTQHLGCPVPSPAIMEEIGTRFPRAVLDLTEAGPIPGGRSGKDDRKIELSRRHPVARAPT